MSLKDMVQLHKVYQDQSPVELPVVFSYSKLDSFRRCPRLYFERYVLRLAPVMKAPALEAGAFIHNFLEGYYKRLSFDATAEASIIQLVREKASDPNIPDTLAAAFLNALAEVNSEILQGDENRSVPVLLAVCAAYAAQYPLDTEDFDIHASEFSFAREIANGVIIEGVLDLIINWQRGLWIMDHKSTRAIGDGKQLRLTMRPNLQASIYVWGSRETFDTCKGLRFNWIQISSKTRNFLRDCTTRTPFEIQEMERNVLQSVVDIWERYAQMTHERDEAPWTMYEHSCNNYGKCDHIAVCTSSKRDLVRGQDFQPREERVPA